MSNRTSNQALKDAREAYNAWCDGKPIEWRREGDSVTRWDEYHKDGIPNFQASEIYWRPAPDQPPEPSKPRTPQQAMREARESGAVEAWENGRPIEWRLERDARWDEFNDSGLPNFHAFGIHWRPKASEPPKPVALDCRPVSEPPEKGDEVFAWDGEIWHYDYWDDKSPGLFHFWAPMPLPPEVK